MSCPECRGHHLVSACPCCSPGPEDQGCETCQGYGCGECRDYDLEHEEREMARAEKRRAREEG
jgi:hypothetical protein